MKAAQKIKTKDQKEYLRIKRIVKNAYNKAFSYIEKEEKQLAKSPRSYFPG